MKKFLKQNYSNNSNIDDKNNNSSKSTVGKQRHSAAPQTYL